MKGKLNNISKKPSLPYIVMEDIKQAILDGYIKPGDLLPSEADISKQTGVGKSSVREAIKMLSVMGIVESIQGEGTYVRKVMNEDGINSLTYQLILMQDDNEHIFQLREILEPAYTLLAMEKATPEDLKEIKATIDIFEQRVELNKHSAEDDLAFHEAILRATHNPFVIKIGQTSMQLFEASIKSSMSSIPRRAVSDHKQIYAAMVSKDRSQLYNAVIESFVGWKQTLQSMKEQNQTHLSDNKRSMGKENIE